MLKIRFKVKHLALFIIFIFVLVVGLYKVTPELLYKKASMATDELEREKYYDIIMNYFPTSNKGIMVMFFSAQQDIQYISHGAEPGLIYIFPGSTGMSGQPVNEAEVKLAIENLEYIREKAPDSPWSTHALKELGKAYYLLNDYNNAIKYLNQSIEETKMEAVESTILLVNIYFNNGQLEKALALAEQSLTQKPGGNPLELMVLKGKILMNMERFELARQVFIDLPKKAETIYSNHLQEEGRKVINLNIEHYVRISNKYLRQLTALEENPSKQGGIYGKVFKNGNGLANARVYLIDNEVDEDYYTGDTGNLLNTITKDDGSFSFKGLIPGNYSLAVGLKVSQIDGYTMQLPKGEIILQSGDKVVRNLRLIPTVKLISPSAEKQVGNSIEFKWTPTENTAYYDLFIGPVTRTDDGSIQTNYTTVIKSNIKQSHWVLDIEKNWAELRLHGGIAYENGTVNPESILGFLRNDGEYTWGVYAYDDSGNRITDSSGFKLFTSKDNIPIFKVKAGSLTKADKLLLDRKYDEAIKEYKRQLENNPDDVHSLTILARLYQYGIKVGKADPKKAIIYYEKLAKIKDNPKVRSELASLYKKVSSQN